LNRREAIRNAIAAGVAGFPTVNIGGRAAVDLRLPNPPVVHPDQLVAETITPEQLRNRLIAGTTSLDKIAAGTIAASQIAREISHD
jgi:hypothetical protein